MEKLPGFGGFANLVNFVLKDASHHERDELLVWCASRLNVWVQYTVNVAIAGYRCEANETPNLDNPAVQKMQEFCKAMIKWSVAVHAANPNFVAKLGQTWELLGKVGGAFTPFYFDNLEEAFPTEKRTLRAGDLLMLKTPDAVLKYMRRVFGTKTSATAVQTLFATSTEEDKTHTIDVFVEHMALVIQALLDFWAAATQTSKKHQQMFFAVTQANQQTKDWTDLPELLAFKRIVQSGAFKTALRAEDTLYSLWIATFVFNNKQATQVMFDVFPDLRLIEPNFAPRDTSTDETTHLFTELNRALARASELNEFDNDDLVWDGMMASVKFGATLRDAKARSGDSFLLSGLERDVFSMLVPQDLYYRLCRKLTHSNSVTLDLAQAAAARKDLHEFAQPLAKKTHEARDKLLQKLGQFYKSADVVAALDFCMETGQSAVPLEWSTPEPRPAWHKTYVAHMAEFMKTKELANYLALLELDAKCAETIEATDVFLSEFVADPESFPDQAALYQVLHQSVQTAASSTSNKIVHNLVHLMATYEAKISKTPTKKPARPGFVQPPVGGSTMARADGFAIRSVETDLKGTDAREKFERMRTAMETSITNLYRTFRMPGFNSLTIFEQVQTWLGEWRSARSELTQIATAEVTGIVNAALGFRTAFPTYSEWRTPDGYAQNQTTREMRMRYRATVDNLDKLMPTHFDALTDFLTTLSIVHAATITYHIFLVCQFRVKWGTGVKPKWAKQVFELVQRVFVDYELSTRVFNFKAAEKSGLLMSIQREKGMLPDISTPNLAWGLISSMSSNVSRIPTFHAAQTMLSFVLVPSLIAGVLQIPSVFTLATKGAELLAQTAPPAVKLAMEKGNEGVGKVKKIARKAGKALKKVFKDVTSYIFDAPNDLFEVTKLPNIQCKNIRCKVDGSFPGTIEIVSNGAGLQSTNTCGIKVSVPCIINGQEVDANQIFEYKPGKNIDKLIVTYGTYENTTETIVPLTQAPTLGGKIECKKIWATRSALQQDNALKPINGTAETTWKFADSANKVEANLVYNATAPVTESVEVEVEEEPSSSSSSSTDPQKPVEVEEDPSSSSSSSTDPPSSDSTKDTEPKPPSLLVKWGEWLQMLAGPAAVAANIGLRYLSFKLYVNAASRSAADDFGNTLWQTYKNKFFDADTFHTMDRKFDPFAMFEDTSTKPANEEQTTINQLKLMGKNVSRVLVVGLPQLIPSDVAAYSYSARFGAGEYAMLGFALAGAGALFLWAILLSFLPTLCMKPSARFGIGTGIYAIVALIFYLCKNT